MRTIAAIAVTVALTFGAMASYAQVATPDVQGGAQATMKVAVHTRVRPEVMNRPLTPDEEGVRRTYMDKWGVAKMSAENRQCISDALALYLRMGVFHVPGDYGREPRVLFAMYQQDTEWRNPLKVDVWADVPVCRQYTPPLFTPAAPAAPITPLAALADVSVPSTEALTFTSTQLYKVGVEQARALELADVSVPCTEALTFTSTQLYKVGVEQARALELADISVPSTEALTFTSTQLYKVGVEEMEPLKLRPVRVPCLPRVRRCEPEAERPHGGCTAPASLEERGAQRFSEPGSERVETTGGLTYSESEVRCEGEQKPTNGECPTGGSADVPTTGEVAGNDGVENIPTATPDPKPGTDSPGGGGRAITDPNGDGVPAPPIDGTGPEPLSPDGGDIVTVL